MRDVVDVLAWLGRIAPTRLAGSEGERALQQAVAGRLARSGYRTEWQRFRFPRHLYGNLALHGGLALAFAALIPLSALVAAGGLALVAVSFYVELALRRPVLRRLWPRVATQNAILTLPATGSLRRRIVFVAHSDSAYTGVMFAPSLLKVMAAPPPRALSFFAKPLRLPWLSMIALAAASVASLRFAVPVWLIALIAIPLAIMFAFNLDVVIRNTVVPGAADNLSGCAAQVVLAEAWAEAPVDGVEMVFVFTGAEEAGTGGAAFLSNECRSRWDPEHTDVIVLDTLSNGELFVLEEGELARWSMPASLLEAVRLAAARAGVATPRPYVIPAGATDAFPFLRNGYRALALTCIDPTVHAARHYHHPSDTVENVDASELVRSVSLVGSLIDVLAERKEAPSTPQPISGALPRQSSSAA